MDLEQSGADYLRKLKTDADRLVTPFAAKAAAPLAQAEAQPATLGNGPERRRSPRYKCEGSAEFRVGGTDVRTWGTFTDLSMHGCYIEMTATFPVGSMVDLVLELSGTRVTVKGEVRVSYPFLGIGVAFREVTPENEHILKSMVASLLAQQRVATNASNGKEAVPISAPLIANPSAALQAIVGFFETHPILTKNEFLQLIRKSQTQAR